MTDRPQLVIISGCSGYGGLDEAVIAATGGRVVAHIEYDDAPAKILDHHYPGIPNYRDVTKVDWLAMADDVVPEGAELCLTAGYPCQPFSSAGKRRGVDDERHLWPYFAEAIRQLRPALVVFENVRNHLNLGFDVVLADLAEIGYDTTWTLLRASDVGAPHGRARLFIVGRRRAGSAPARTPIARLEGDGWVEPADGLFGSVEWAGKIPTTGRVVDGAMWPLVLPEVAVLERPSGDLLPTPDAGVFNDGQDVDVYRERKARELAKGYNGNGGGTPLAMPVRLLPTPEAKLSDSGPDYARANRDHGGGGGGDDLTTTVFRAFISDDPERQLLPSPTAALPSAGHLLPTPTAWEHALAVTLYGEADQRMLPTPTAMDALGSRNATCYRGPEAGDNNSGTTLTDVVWQAAGVDGPASEPPPYTAITDWGPYAAAVRRWEAVVGPAPAPTEPNAAGKQRLAPAFPEWMMGLPRGWVTEVPGITRNEQLKAIGNGVVPQQGYVAIMRMLVAVPW